jgi:hypothetical protein
MWPEQRTDWSQTQPSDWTHQTKPDPSDLAQADITDHYESGDNDNEEKPLLGTIANPFFTILKRLKTQFTATTHCIPVCLL